MAKTITCPFCGTSFSWVGRINYWDEYFCDCGANLWMRIIKRMDEDNEIVQINCLDG